MANTTEHPVHRGFVPPKLPKPLSPALAKHAEARAASVQNRIADVITRFAGSIAFVYFHIIWFAVWIILGIEGYPFGLLTMIVSLEAIFLSTFVMISQNGPTSSDRPPPISSGRWCRRRTSRTNS
jgi:uncharacterized membrane protein